MSAISVRMPQDLGTALEAEADREGRSRSDLIRDAVAAYLERRAHERFLAELRRAAAVVQAAGGDDLGGCPVDDGLDDLIAAEDAAGYGRDEWWR